MEKAAKSAKEWNLSFAEGSGQYGLIEVDEALLAEILQTGGATIKQASLNGDEGKSTCLSSESRTHKLKLSETSNFLMVADLKTQSILLQTSTFVEATPTTTKTF